MTQQIRALLTTRAIAKLLGQTNEMLTDMLWMQCNDGAGHKTTVRTGLPSATWRLLNYGVQNQHALQSFGDGRKLYAKFGKLGPMG